MDFDQAREEMLRSRRNDLERDLKRLLKKLVNVEVRIDYYDGQIQALKSVPHLEAAE